MKKISALLMAVCLGAGLLPGCASGGEKKADDEKAKDTGKRLLYSEILRLTLKTKNLM